MGLSLPARRLTTGEIAARFEEVLGRRSNEDTISRITEKIIGVLVCLMYSCWFFAVRGPVWRPGLC